MPSVQPRGALRWYSGNINAMSGLESKRETESSANWKGHFLRALLSVIMCVNSCVTTFLIQS